MNERRVGVVSVASDEQQELTDCLDLLSRHQAHALEKVVVLDRPVFEYLIETRI
jgi:hypothetical protein